MITIRYRGGIGNKFFVYCYGRILAERFGYSLSCMPILGYSNTKQIGGSGYNKDFVKMTFGNMKEIVSDLEKQKNHKILMSISIQRYNLYKDYKKEIKNWLKPDLKIINGNLSNLDFRTKKDGVFKKVTVDKIEEDDVVIIQRLKNFVDLRCDMKFGYFNTILKKIKYKRLFIISDELESDFFDQFADYQPIYLFGDPFVHYVFPSLFKKMIIAQSTFSWWIAWLSDAKEIYFPFSASGYWSPRYLKHKHVNLIVDEDRYKMVREFPKASDFNFVDKTEVLNSIVEEPLIAGSRHSHPDW